jgi:hypothetical protein
MIDVKDNKINIFNLIQKDNIIQIFIKDSSLNIDINKEFLWATEIKIKNNIFYFIYKINHYVPKKILCLHINKIYLQNIIKKNNKQLFLNIYIIKTLFQKIQ